MMLNLTDEEARDLDTALLIYLDELQREVLHTDRRELRHDLRERLERLEGIKARLDALVAGRVVENA